MAIVDISVVPIGTKTTSVREFVKESLKIIRKSGLKYQVSSMGTAIEGKLDEVLPIIKAIHNACFRKGAKRLLTTIKIDDRRDRHQTMEDKIRAVLEE